MDRGPPRFTTKGIITMELGIYTFGEIVPDPHTGKTLTFTERTRQLMDTPGTCARCLAARSRQRPMHTCFRLQELWLAGRFSR